MRNTYGTDFAITNSGGLRADLTCPAAGGGPGFCPPSTPPPFPITRGKVLDLLPFGNVVATVTINGVELKDFLENVVQPTPAVAIGRFGQVSGLCVTYNITQTARTINADGSGVPNTGNRVLGAVRQAADGSCTGAAVTFGAGDSYTLADQRLHRERWRRLPAGNREARLRNPGHHGSGGRGLRDRE